MGETVLSIEQTKYSRYEGWEMEMKKSFVALFIGSLLLTGCGSETSQESGVAVLSEENAQVETGVDIADAAEENVTDGDGENSDEENTSVDASEADEQEETVSGVFAELPDKFVYSGGAGGWATELYLNDDGTFTAQYHDSDLGYTGADYPNGTVYISNYTGKFTEPQVVNEYTYSMAVEYIELEMEAGQEYYEDGIRYVTCPASEFADSGELLVYLPGAMRGELPEGFISWTNYGDFSPEQDFRCYGIYNPVKELAFIGYRFTDFEQLQKLGGTFRNESGDEFVIDVYQDSDNLVDEIGSVYWMPHDGEKQEGHVYKAAEGGFRICLPESVEYCFDITDTDVNHTQFAGEGYTGELGTFTKVE